ncbi:amidohydrolase family protein [Halomicrobium mukohataei]|uniref:Amidohydrolase family protein n=1 Tax=Halomicrobium mukohataei TaxID=57705 RepID=A0A847UDL9_9EURY|nr:amidohydrolase family protein [Halomicrobium mukohataei]
MTADFVVHDAVVVTVDERNRVYESGTVVVRDGDIATVRESRAGDAEIDADHVLDGAGRLVLPGFVNAHAHLEGTALTGAFSEMGPVELFAQMTPLIADMASEHDDLLRAGYELAALTHLQGGVTTVNTMDVRPALGADILGEAGLRAVMGPMLSDLFWDRSVDAQFERARSFVEQFDGSYDGRISAALCPHDDWSCTRDLWERVADLAAEYPEVPVHTHLLELGESDEMARANGSDDSLALLDAVGLLDDRLVGAHFRVADERDVERMSEADAGVAHCPSIFGYYNLDPETPWTPVADLREAGVAVGLGLDDHYWHDSVDLFEEARSARLLANLDAGAQQYDSMALVRMLTAESADAVGIESVGRLVPGARGDLAVLDVDQAKFTPLTNVAAQLANGARRSDVETVVVDGEVVVEDGVVQTMDAQAVRERATAAVEQFAAATEWDLGLGTPEPPALRDVLADAPKRGPAKLLGRLGAQKLRDVFR